MNYLVKLALRNIGRNRRRSILAVISVSLSIMFIIFLQAFINGLQGSMVKNYTKNETGHVRIASRDFEENRRFLPVTKNVKNPAGLINDIKSNPSISAQIDIVTQRVQFGAVLSHKGRSKPAAALAGDPAVEKDLLMLQNSILPGGRYLENNREMIMGVRLAAALGYKVGDTVKVVTQGSDFALHMRKFIITGLFKTGLLMLDDVIFQIPLADAQKLLRMGHAVQQIVIMLKDYNKAPQAASIIRGMVRDTNIVVTPWTQIGDYYNLIKMQKSIYGWMYAIIAFLGAVIISNIMMMVVLERRKEIGIMKSMGVSRRELLILFSLEGLMLGVLGSLMGALLGTGLNTVLRYTGMDLTNMMKDFKFPIDNVIYVEISLASVFSIFMLGTSIAALMSVFPSQKAAKMDVVEAIKSV